MDINEIKTYLPHRYPFLLVDKIVDIEEKKITGIKNVTVNESFFQGHFPGHPVMPGVLIIEALAQTCGVLALKREENRGKLAYFISINNAKFRKPVFPGDVLRLEVVVTKHKSRIIQAHGVAKVGENVVCEADLLFSVVDKK
ncbi:MAG: 3-hydroxyacyl-ACP dehydratase FabZ [Candidatus Omnitrophota bacterium]|nr:MAG: 3-hydroxyacyl-ACP dehydratase FabZ [Candidatus Omnitrophota bacterium]